MNGRWTPSSASRSATLVWVSPPALTIATSKSRWCSRSISAPSWFDWKKSTVEAELRGPRRDPGVDLVERLVAVDLGLARPDEVEVRALQDQDARSSRRSRRPAATRPRGHDVVGDVRPDLDAVRGRQHPAEPAAGMLLVGREVLEDRRRAA